jgi:aspartyl protease family protein
MSASTTRRLGLGMWLGMCVALLMILTIAFNGLLERQQQPGRPVAVNESGSQIDVLLRANRQGHYLASGRINGQSVTFLLDTGASSVSIPASVASELGLRRGAPTRYATANGVITAYRTELDSVELGPIQLKGVRGSINPHAPGDQVLLGMSFLRHLELRQRDGELLLRQYR